MNPPPSSQAPCFMSGQGLGEQNQTGGEWVNGKDRTMGIMRHNSSMKGRINIY